MGLISAEVDLGRKVGSLGLSRENGTISESVPIKVSEVKADRKAGFWNKIQLPWILGCRCPRYSTHMLSSCSTSCTALLNICSLRKRASAQSWDTFELFLSMFLVFPKLTCKCIHACLLLGKFLHGLVCYVDHLWVFVCFIQLDWCSSLLLLFIQTEDARQTDSKSLVHEAVQSKDRENGGDEAGHMSKPGENGTGSTLSSTLSPKLLQFSNFLLYKGRQACLSKEFIANSFCKLCGSLLYWEVVHICYKIQR